MGSGGRELTFDESANKFIIETFGWQVDEDGVIVNSDGEWIPSYSGEKAYFNEFAGIVKDREGDPTPLRQDFAELAGYVGDNRER